MKPPVSIFRYILLTGIISGFLDGTAACIHFLVSGGKDPGVVFKYIASGLVGRDKAFSGGFEMVLLGVAIHLLVAFCFTIFYFWLQPRSFLKRNVILSAIIYGLFTWVIMNRVVIPLSRIRQRPFDLDNAAIGAGILILCIGLPLALMARKYYLYNK